MKNKKGFTLVELLAVIAILAILVILALPNVINLYNRAQKETFLTEVKKIHSEAEKKYISSSINGNTIKTINSEDDSKLDMTGEKLQYCINLNNSGKVTSMKVSNHKWIASLEDGESVEDLTIDDLEDGNLDDYQCTGTSSVPAVYCTFDGELKQGAEYVKGQYTYRYMQEYKINYDSTSEDDTFLWKNISQDGWGVILTDKTSADAVTTNLCTYINNKSVVSMSAMFSDSQAKSIDLSSFNTNKVIDMDFMFYNSNATTLDLSNFDTSNVNGMTGMFYNSNATTLDLSNFNTSKVTDMTGMFMSVNAKTINGLNKFDTSRVTSMRMMFSDTKVPVLDLSSFNTSNVTDMGWMFDAASATEIKGLNKFNTSKVVEMSYMFSDVPTTVIDVSNFNTTNVTSMEGMFWGAQEVTTLDLNNFNTSNVTKMHAMFYDCENLKTIYASEKFVTNSVTDGNGLFRENINLVGGNGTKFDSSNYGKYGSGDIALARIDAVSTPGYFTAK